MNLSYSFIPYANSVESTIPEFWAKETLALLWENMVAARLVHTDFKNELQDFGDTVNVQRPAKFTFERKDETDDVTIQDATVTNTAVVLNQHAHVSFTIKDRQMSLSKYQLIDLFVRGAAGTLASGIDKIILGQYPQFLNTTAGKLGSATTSTLRGYMLDMRNAQNLYFAPMDGRNQILTPNIETIALNTDIFAKANERGDGGDALNRARLGFVNGYNNFMCQNMASISYSGGTLAGAINNAAGYAKGHATSMAVDGFTGAVNVGDWLTIAGDMTPYRVTAKTDTLGATTAITLDRALRSAVANDAVITAYLPYAVNLAAGYASGWAKRIVIDNGGDSSAVAPQVGQMVSFESTTVTSASPIYTVISRPSSTTMLLDRPLEEALTDDHEIHVGPKGEYNMAFTRNAIALVTRPLATPMEGAGARAASVEYNGIGLRACIGYDIKAQGHVVNLDVLLGIKKLYDDLGGVMFG